MYILINNFARVLKYLVKSQQQQKARRSSNKAAAQGFHAQEARGAAEEIAGRCVKGNVK